MNPVSAGSCINNSEHLRLTACKSSHFTPETAPRRLVKCQTSSRPCPITENRAFKVDLACLYFPNCGQRPLTQSRNRLPLKEPFAALVAGSSGGSGVDPEVNEWIEKVASGRVETTESLEVRLRRCFGCEHV